MRALVALAAVLAAAPVLAMPDQGKWEFVPNEVCFAFSASAALPYLASLADKMSAIQRFLYFFMTAFDDDLL
jgi:hypothetical protein